MVVVHRIIYIIYIVVIITFDMCIRWQSKAVVRNVAKRVGVCESDLRLSRVILSRYCVNRSRGVVAIYENQKYILDGEDGVAKSIYVYPIASNKENYDVFFK